MRASRATLATMEAAAMELQLASPSTMARWGNGWARGCGPAVRAKSGRGGRAPRRRAPGGGAVKEDNRRPRAQAAQRALHGDAVRRGDAPGVDLGDGGPADGEGQGFAATGLGRALPCLRAKLLA